SNSRRIEPREKNAMNPNNEPKKTKRPRRAKKPKSSTSERCSRCQRPNNCSRFGFVGKVQTLTLLCHQARRREGDVCPGSADVPRPLRTILMCVWKTIRADGTSALPGLAPPLKCSVQ